MTEQEKSQLLSRVKFCYQIVDPFPEHTFYEQSKTIAEQLLGLIGMDKNKFVPEPEKISIWKAYRMGEQAAINRLEEALDDPTKI